MNDRPAGDASSAPADPARRRYLALRNAVDEAVLEVDADGRLVDVADAFVELSGYDRGELRGAPLSSVLHGPTADGFGVVRSRLREPGRDVVTVEWSLRTAGGETVPTTWRFAGLESDGEFRGAIATVVASRDRLEPVDGHRIQHAASRRIAAATSLSDGLESVLRTVCERIGWEYGEAWLPMSDADRIERATVAHCGSAEFRRFGEHSSGTTFARGEGLPGRVWASGDPEWLADVSSGDDFVRSDLAEAVGLDTAFGAPVVADGHVFAVLVFATAERLPVDDHLVETVVSVGSGLGGLIARLQTEDALEHERELLERVLAASPVGIAVFEPDGSIERLNERAAAFLDLEDDEDVAAYTVGDRPMFDADDERLSFEERPVNRVFETGEPVAGRDLQLQSRDGGTRWLSVNATPIAGEDGDPEYVVSTATDVTQLKTQADRLERQRDDLRSELEDVFERITDGFYALDDEWRFTYLNEYAEAFLDRSADDLLGKQLWTEYPNPERRARFERAMETGTPITYEEYSATADAWVEANVYPSETGLSVYFRDVTERRERKRELECRTRQQRAVATLGRRALETDDLDELMAEATRLVADVLDVAYCKVLERQSDAPELIVRHGVGWDEGVVGSATVSTDERSQAGYTLVSGEPIAVDDFDHETRFSSPDLLVDHDVSSGISAIVGAVGEQWGVLGVHDVDPREFTDDDVNFVQSVASVLGSAIDRMRTETTLRRERQLTEQIVETSPVGITVVDAEGNLRFANERAEEIFGRTKRELNALAYDGTEWDERDADGEPIENRPFSRIMASGEPVFDELSSVRRPDGDRVWLSTSGAPLVDTDGTPDGVVFVIEDVTERRERERELERYETIVETISDGVFVLDEDGRFVMVNDAHVELTGYSREELLGEHASLITGEAVTAEARRLAEALAADDGRSHASLDALVHRPDGELVPAESRITVLTDDDGELRGRIGVARDISDRVERERQLERQREQLAALNELNGVVREATDAIIEQSTREQIEQIVCERLADSDSYLFAWIGAVDRGTDTVRPRAQAGTTSLLEDVTIPLDPTDGDTGPTSTAVQNREIQTTQNVLAEAPYEPWRERVEADDVQSAAAIPIVHEETLYGVLSVYADRPNAFTKDERTVVGQLGELVGHAIAAVERKRALLSDDVIELEILVRDFFESMDVDCRDRIDFDRTVSVGDSEYLVYGTTSEAGLRTLEELVDRRPHWETATVIADRFGDVTFELRMSESPLLSALSPYGGSRGRLAIDDGTLWMTAHVPQGSDVRQVIDSIRDVYPGAEAIARRQASTTSSSSRGIRRAWAEELTDRQRASLETAYYAGFFEWPRHSSGEDIADSLGIAPPTFHQHVRAAERKLFDALFDESG
ncbi:PAS domain S-box protein [Natronobeatus ordinarius]|uniref:PAS domain S-box protein n=1 Tax=Natronobeatus ordinarius TaxID=2963433 RepID=UPI0020CE6083|nr:PAS domain S-box protein [Natronobeatus ordinarius]